MLPGLTVIGLDRDTNGPRYRPVAVGAVRDNDLSVCIPLRTRLADALEWGWVTQNVLRSTEWLFDLGAFPAHAISAATRESFVIDMSTANRRFGDPRLAIETCIDETSPDRTAHSGRPKTLCG
ncbi:hypothetical protein L833_5052 [Mycobacteroides abscessus MAB_091912_2446]|uniref:Uncharacterized protein n=1 Tax=Mycobacteroides abscessus MAB_091912_2446 TaxID=1335414 RepID=A0A829M4C0_9MYCO|nr:hypothetical protein L833_5052 [Mycobacteroides abscessus MAB_091912_2446]